MSQRHPAVYILASQPNGTLYVGVTSNLNRRIWQHKTGELEGFTKKHKVHRLVYYEFLNTMPAAIQREKTIKKWRRAWKVALIEERNPDCLDLYEELR